MLTYPDQDSRQKTHLLLLRREVDRLLVVQHFHPMGLIAGGEQHPTVLQGGPFD